MSTDPLVDDYVRRLEAAARRLPRRERDELVGEIRAHLSVALRPGDSEATVRNVLDDLGAPEEIVAAARPQPAPATSPPTSKGWGSLAVAVAGVLLVAVPAVPILLGIGAIVLGVGGRRAARAVGTTDGPATVGMVTGVVVVVLGVLVLLFLLPVTFSRSSDDGEQRPSVSEPTVPAEPTTSVAPPPS